MSWISEYVGQYILPKEHGVVSPDWFTTKRLGRPNDDNDGWKGFASELLTVVPLLHCFLMETVEPTGKFVEHIRCFGLLRKLIDLLSMGADSALAHIDLISRTLREHGLLFRALYPDHIKPKFHHLFHVVDHMRNLNKLLSCFVTERKHRSTKAYANHTFKHYETTLATNMLNTMVDGLHDDQIFAMEYLLAPRPLPTGPVNDWLLSSGAQLRNGRVSKGDVVMMACGVVGVLERMAQNVGDGSLWLVVRRWAPLSVVDFATVGPGCAAFPSTTFLSTLAYRKEANGKARIVLPRQAAAW